MPITFGPPRPHPIEVNVRTVYRDGTVVGRLFGMRPSPSNPNRPTGYRWAPADWSGTQFFTRLSEARATLTATLGTTALRR